ncbi:MAG: DegQ family serine endoprotease [Chitinispirillaceae bacterium]|nr:DegQ family serine endoprotease [Chitinispirillaceae bacterium]
MKKPTVKTLIPISISLAFVVVMGLVFLNTCSFADSKRPDRGSIPFGAQNKPTIKIPPGMEGFSTIIADVAEKVVPTVVSVIPTKIDTVLFSSNPFYQFFDSPFDDFFGFPQPRQRGAPPPVQKREYRQQGLGSGVIVSKDGYILTNFHVVAGANEIEVKTSDNRSFQATVIGSDSLSDVAVIKIKEKVKDLPVAYLGDSDKLRPGDWSIAIGNPFSLTSSVTLGIISALNRSTGSRDMYQNFIQTDAAINPGNSGGALVNIRGELIGINTMIYTRSGGYMGIGFAIPINMARGIMEDLIYEGKVSRGWLGVMIQDLDPATRDALGLSAKTKGVLIGDVFKGQPAEKAGIKRGDIIIAVDGKPVAGTNGLRNAIAAIHPGKKVPIEVLRDGKKMTKFVKLAGRDEKAVASGSSGKGGEEKPAAADMLKKLGITVRTLTGKESEERGIDASVRGVIIEEVGPSSPAAYEGLQKDDVILEVNRRAVPSVKEFKKAVKGLKSGDSVLLLLLREGNTFFKAFKLQ